MAKSKNFDWAEYGLPTSSRNFGFVTGYPSGIWTWRHL